MIVCKGEYECYRATYTDGRHQGYVDTSIENGGGESAFRAHALLEASVAACINIWIRMYATHHGIPLSRVVATVELDTESKEAEAVFRYGVELQGALDDAQRNKLLQISRTCPVRQTLSKNIIFAPMHSQDLLA